MYQYSRLHGASTGDVETSCEQVALWFEYQVQHLSIGDFLLAHLQVQLLHN